MKMHSGLAMRGGWRSPALKLALGVLAAQAFCLPARAADFVFNGSSGTDWNTAANWTPPGPPGHTDRADIAGGLTATLDASPPSDIDTLYIGGNTDGPTANDNAQSNTMGDGTLNQTGGDLVVNTWGVVGVLGTGPNAGAGTYNLSGGTFHQKGTDNFTVGQGGKGTFNVSGNAAVTIDNILNVGRWSDTTGPNTSQGRGNGTIVQSGNSTVTVSGNSTNNNDAIFIGHFGDGSYTIKDSATLNSAKDITVGSDATSTGLLTQSGGTLSQTGGWFYVGRNTGATGTYNLSGGNVTVAGRFFSAFSGTGTVNQTGGTLTVGGDTNVADNGGTGVYNFSAGTLNANGGVNVGGWNNSNGTLNLSGTAALKTTDFSVGRNDPNSDPTANNSVGLVNQTGGSVTVSGHLVLGLDATNESNGNTKGTYTLSGGQLKLGTNGLQIGGTGQGTAAHPGATGIFNLNGGTLDAAGQAIAIGQGAGSASAFNFTGGTLQNASSINFPLTQTGGTLHPGPVDGTGKTTITTGDYTNSGGSLLVDLTTAGKNDELVLSSGTFHLSGASLTVHVPGGGQVPAGQYTIVDPTSTGTGVFSNAAATVLGDNGQAFTVSYHGGDGDDIVLSVVPEPAALGLLGLGALGLMVRRRR